MVNMRFLKSILFLATLIAVTATMAAQGFYTDDYGIRGYKSFYEAGYGFDVSDGSDSPGDNMFVTTTQGYQFNSRFFTGIGMGYEYYAVDGGTRKTLPMFIEFRGNILDTKVSPFVAARAGLFVGDGNTYGAYYAGTAGVRFARRNFDHAFYLGVQAAIRNERSGEFHNMRTIGIILGFEI